MSKPRQAEGAESSWRRLPKKLWLGAFVLYGALFFFPIQYPVSRLAIVLGAVALWGGALYVWWQRRWVRVSLLVFLGLLVTLVALPGREPDPEALRADYRRGLSLFGQAKYVWGGETVVGIDCSGFVREGLVAGQLMNGIRTLNGAPIRSALALWWTDASALALRDGYHDLTVSLGEYDSVNAIGPDVAEVGDLAVTADGAHVLVYVGDQTWMQADPGSGRVVTATAPSTNGWYETPVVLMRWTTFAD